MTIKKHLSTLIELTDLREVWPHEALDFTPWLADNIELLSNAIGIDIAVKEIEDPVGSFNVDIYGYEIGTDKPIIIENQLENTNHDHLGKLITYAAGKKANYIIWLVKSVREEHKSAIEWLNNHTDNDTNFFLCEIKLYCIGNSDPAVKFEIAESPNNWQKVIKKENSANSTEQKRYDYWVAFQDYAFQNKEFENNFSKRTPSLRQWLSYSIGSSEAGLNISQILSRNEIRVEIYINQDMNLYNKLLDNKETIEKACGFSLDWQELSEKKSKSYKYKREC